MAAKLKARTAKGDASAMRPKVSSAAYREMTIDELIDPDDPLKSHIAGMMHAEPFYTAVIRELSRVRSSDVPTMGVTPNPNGTHTLLWNPKFVEMFSRDCARSRGLLIHESLHIVLEHTSSRRLEPHGVANVAYDLAVNSFIGQRLLPDDCLFPGVKFKGDLADSPLSLRIAKLPPMKASEFYFAELMKDKEAAAQAADMAPGQFTISHEMWDELSDEERDFVRTKVKLALEKAAKEADGHSSGNGWGSVPQEARELIRSIINRDVPWDQVLSAFARGRHRSERSSTLKRASRRIPGWQPGVRKKSTASIGILIDQSGSVSNDDLEAVSGALKHLQERITFHVWTFDTEVDVKSHEVWRKGGLTDLKRTKSGGSDITAACKFAESQGSIIDGYIVVSDLECSAPGPARLPRAWVITPYANPMFDIPPGDTSVRMPTRASK